MSTARLTTPISYRLELEHRETDNPDQRIAEDLRSFTSGTLSLSLGLLSSAVTLGSFIVILWSISGPLSFNVGDTTITIPAFMVWAALLYAIVGSILTHYVGRHLIGINFRQERFEADFRFSLVRLRENAEGVALNRGESSEAAHLHERFGNIQANWRELMRYTRHRTARGSTAQAADGSSKLTRQTTSTGTSVTVPSSIVYAFTTGWRKSTSDTRM